MSGGDDGCALAGDGRAGGRERPKARQERRYNPDAQTVEMFAAMEKGVIAVKLIPKDSTQSKIVIENKTDKPLSVKLPDAFAGVPVLAQAAAGGAGGGRRSGSSWQQQGQSRRRRRHGRRRHGRRHVQRPGRRRRKAQRPHRLPRSRQARAAARRPLRDQAHRQLHHQARRPRVVPDVGQRPDRPPRGSGRGLAPQQRHDLGATGRQADPPRRRHEPAVLQPAEIQAAMAASAVAERTAKERKSRRHFPHFTHQEQRVRASYLVGCVKRTSLHGLVRFAHPTASLPAAGRVRVGKRLAPLAKPATAPEAKFPLAGVPLRGRPTVPLASRTLL